MFKLPHYVTSQEGFYNNLLEKIYTETATAKTEQEYKNVIATICKQRRRELTDENVLNFFLNEDYENKSLVNDIKQFYIDNAGVFQKIILDGKLKQGNKYTLITMGEFGMIATNKITFDSVTPCQYAQFDDAVKIIYKPFKKRSLYQRYLYDCEVLIYEGWKDIDDSVLWDTEETETLITKTGKYSSAFDKRMFNDVITALGEPLIRYGILRRNDHE